MSKVQGPLLIRQHPQNEPLYFYEPGVHSHNAKRRRQKARQGFKALRWTRLILLLIGISALGYSGYTLSNEYIYQSYENWAFDQKIAGHAATFTDYLRAKTPLSFLLGAQESAAPEESVQPKTQATPRPAVGALLGRVEIPRLHLSAIVREGVDTKVLSVAVGHVPYTAMPGESGNFAIAAHRDTLFRALKDIKKDDLVSFDSPEGTFTYQVLATKIVKPTDVSVLRADGGGLIPGGGNLLTMITCYPFYYVGSAPKRFIVEGKLISRTPVKTASAG
ncbi:MAG TPA: class D sortase [Bryobacteraceae bacterium]|jgi:sortase A|nr:class D sortase [Bryobacteraceae bacterium]